VLNSALNAFHALKVVLVKTRNRIRAFGASLAGIRVGFVQRARAGAIAVAALALSAAVLPQAAFAQSQATDIAVLHSRVGNIDATLARMDDKFTNRFDRMDGRFERMDERLDRLEITAARTDERINGLQSQNNLIVTVLIAVLVPLQLATLGALIAFLTKGRYWGSERKPKSAAARAAQVSPQHLQPS